MLFARRPNAMFKFNNKYTVEQAELMWRSIAFREHRQFAFFDGASSRWQHPKRTFDDFQEFYSYLCSQSISDVHVKPLPDNGGREWVIDVDFEANTPPSLLDLKIRVAVRTFVAFYGNNVARVLHSGNRGVHVWLKIDAFRLAADKELRRKHYKALAKPTKISTQEVRAGSFIGCLRDVVRDPSLLADARRHFGGERVEESQLLLELWPPVDEHIFCNATTQIRAPFSYNYKGRQHQRLLWPQQCGSDSGR
uniref:Late expression factor 1 n=1 Tax=Lymantria dispar multicapsid nuclear polyhedrosis virus TaxID=10449 RepID=A0A1B1MR47_NPVLD|nr:late expression factor 1 [Lymantria dispar multiple nucleopolyhedrovirus]